MRIDRYVWSAVMIATWCTSCKMHSSPGGGDDSDGGTDENTERERDPEPPDDTSPKELFDDKETDLEEQESDSPFETDTLEAPAPTDIHSTTDTESIIDTGSDTTALTDAESDTLESTAPPDTCLDLDIRFDGGYPDEILVEGREPLEAVCTVNGSRIDVTRYVNLTSGNEDIATVDNTESAKGQLTPHGRGEVVIEAHVPFAYRTDHPNIIR